MSQVLTQASKVLQVLSTNNFAFLPTETAYVLAHQDWQFLLREKGITENPVFLFQSSQQLLSYVGDISPAARWLVEVLPPGPVEWVLPAGSSYFGNKSQFSAYISQNEATNQILASHSKPLAAIFPQIGFNALLVNSRHIQESKVHEETFLYQTKALFTGVLPTKIDLTNHEKIVITRPGPIGFNEINNLFRGQVKVVKEYQPLAKFQDDTFKIGNFANLTDQENKLTLVLGTKERLSSYFQISLTEYFQHKKIGNWVLKNLGSQTNLETVAKNLSQSLLDIYKLGFEKVVLLDANWGNSVWAEVIKYHLESVAEPALQYDRENSHFPATGEAHQYGFLPATN